MRRLCLYSLDYSLSGIGSQATLRFHSQSDAIAASQGIEVLGDFGLGEDAAEHDDGEELANSFKRYYSTELRRILMFNATELRLRRNVFAISS